MQHLQAIIEQAFEDRAAITPNTVSAPIRQAVMDTIALLDSGKLRVAEKIAGVWVTHQWLKKAVLLSFRIHDNQVIEGAESRYFDKVPMKFADYDKARFEKEGFRVVPPAAVRQGAYIAKNCVLMPSYVNIGAYVDEGSMVDTWATVGSCAQIGKNVHLSGGVGIGGVDSSTVPGSQADLAAQAGSDVIYFDTNQHDLNSQSRSIAEGQARWLNLYPNLNVTIEGHADERGTREYNIALGDRRANAVKNYMIAIGVDPRRINTISYGKEQPLVVGADGTSWAQNRRARTRVE